MEELLTLFEKEFDEAEGWVNVVDADWYASDLKLSLSIKLADEVPPQLWEVQCEGVVEEQISSSGAESLYLSGNSPRLLPFLEEHYELMFTNNKCKPSELLGVITSCCVDVFGDAKYLHRFLNQSPRLNKIVSSKFGKLGKFPETLSQRLLQELNSLPVSINALSTGLPKKWTGEQFVLYPKLKVLEIEECYIVGERFSAERA